MKYLLTPKGYLFQSKIELDISKLAEGTQLFDTEEAMYKAGAAYFGDSPTVEELTGCHYTIMSPDTYMCDRGMLNDFDYWDDTPKTIEEHLNTFEL